MCHVTHIMCSNLRNHSFFLLSSRRGGRFACKEMLLAAVYIAVVAVVRRSIDVLQTMSKFDHLV